MHNISFTDIPVPRQKSVNKINSTENRKTKAHFMKGTVVRDAIQDKKSSKKASSTISDNSDSEDSGCSTKKVKKKLKAPKTKIRKAMSENKLKV